MQNKSVRNEKRRRKRHRLLPLIIFAAVVFGCMSFPEISRKYIYPCKYSSYVKKYSRMYGVDENLIFAVIKTESGFNPKAESDAGARGLMQIMEDAFEWVNYKMGDDRRITYDDMFEPEYNIEYGTYLIMLLYNEYGNEETAMAAYHSGRGNVNRWLKDKNLSNDGKILSDIPSSVTKHYVSKVMQAYNAYINLYK